MKQQCARQKNYATSLKPNFPLWIYTRNMQNLKEIAMANLCMFPPFVCLQFIMIFGRLQNWSLPKITESSSTTSLDKDRHVELAYSTQHAMHIHCGCGYFWVPSKSEICKWFIDESILSDCLFLCFQLPNSIIPCAWRPSDSIWVMVGGEPIFPIESYPLIAVARLFSSSGCEVNCDVQISNCS